MPTYPARNRFHGEVVMDDRLTITQESAGTRQALRLIGANALGQILEAFDYTGLQPIGAMNTDGASFGAFGDRLSSFYGADIANPAFATLTHDNDNVSSNAGGIHLGHGSGIVRVYVGTGAPGSSYPVTTGVPANGSLYFRQDGALTTPVVYQVRSGAWVPILPAPKTIQIKIFTDTDTVTTGDGKAIFCIPSDMDGMNLVDADAFVTTVSSSGTPTVQIRNVTDAVDMLSTRVTIDASENTSYTAATPAVVDTAHDDVATGDGIAIDVDVAGTGAKGLGVVLRFAY